MSLTETKHWKDWPNAAAVSAPLCANLASELQLMAEFNYWEDHRDRHTGAVPNYVAGTLYRTGPNACKVECDLADQHSFSVSHR